MYEMHLSDETNKVGKICCSKGVQFISEKVLGPVTPFVNGR